MKQTNSDMARELIRKYPKASTRALGRILYKQNKECFMSQDAARNAVRRVRGAMGNYHRQHVADKSMFEDRKDKETAFPILPEPWVEMPDWHIEKFDGPLKVAILADLHIPFHEKLPIELAVDYCTTRNADMVLLNGDVCDFFSASSWVNDPRLRNFQGEVDTINQLLDYIRSKFPKANIVFKYGNHEERLERYLIVKAPELLGLTALSLGELFDFPGRGITEIKDMKPLKLGKLHVIHGHEYRFPISNPVNAARGLFLRSKSLCLCNHFHQSSQHSEKKIDDAVVSCWSGGALCNLHPKYRPLNNWNHGFSFVTVDKDGSFQVENPRIIDGAVWE